MPSRISGQIAMMVIVSLIIIHVVLTAAFFLGRPDHRRDAPPDQLVTLVKLVNASVPELRPRLVADIAAVFPQLGLALGGVAPGEGGQLERDPYLDGLRRHLGSSYEVRVASPGVVAIRLRDDVLISVRVASRPPPQPFGPLSVTLLSIAVIVTLLGFWAARTLTGPLRRFARAAENFTPGGDIAPLPERGPYEIRAAARALNRMRERIKSLLDERTRMLAAVSHDLRTPITRLRLRCEFIDDEATRTRMLDELTHMNGMVENVLTFLRDSGARRQRSMVDVAISVQTICNQFADAGYEVRYHGPDHVVGCVQPEELHQALTNLVDNAVRYGNTVDVRLTETPSSIAIAIEDDGPGIVDADKERVLEPFVRGDASRNMSHNAGFGLGLSIARSVVEAHGGTLALINRVPSGLTASVTLPRSEPLQDAKVA